MPASGGPSGVRGLDKLRPGCYCDCYRSWPIVSDRMSDTSHYNRNAYTAAPARCSTMEEMNLIYPNPHSDVLAQTTSVKVVA